MTTPTPDAPKARRRLIVELVGLVLMLAGAAGVGVAGFAYDTRAGLALVSLYAILAGYALSSRRV